MERLTAVLICLLTSAECANIIGVFPYASKSHHIIGSDLLKELADRGHEVTMISPYQFSKPYKNYRDITLDGIVEVEEEKKKRLKDLSLGALEKNLLIARYKEYALDAILSNQNLKAFMAEKPKCDLVILMPVLGEALLVIGHELGCPTVPFSVLGGSLLVEYYTGNVFPPSYVPNLLLQYSDEMNFIQRVMNTVASVFVNYHYHFENMPMQERMLKKYYPNLPPVKELLQNVDLILINSHIATETPRAYPSNAIQIGGFNFKQNQTLPNDLETFLNESKHGVLLFSFGTNIDADVFSEEKMQIFLNTFGKSKYDFLWKTDFKSATLPSNVKAVQWLPQTAVLEHPNVKAFITHSGLGSTAESVFYGVPMICIPIFGDQLRNAGDTVNNGYGVQLDLNALTEEQLSASINEIVENVKYRETIALKSSLLKEQEINPLDKAIFWVEHVIKHKGAKHMKQKSASMPLYKVMLMDVMAFLFLLSSLFLYLLYLVIRLIYRLIKKQVIKLRKNESHRKLKKH